MRETSVHGEASYRYYCDNDPQDESGGTRWTLREDPPYDQRPTGYLPQRERSLRTGTRNYQEWEDTLNGVSDAHVNSYILIWLTVIRTSR